MEELLRIRSVSQSDETYPSLESNFLVELTLRVHEENGTIYYQVPPSPSGIPDYELRHGVISPTEIIVALGSAGIFTAVYQALASYLTRNKDRELELAKSKVTITIKGHSLPEEIELIKELAPELLPKAGKLKGKGRSKGRTRAKK